MLPFIDHAWVQAAEIHAQVYQGSANHYSTTDRPPTRPASRSKFSPALTARLENWAHGLLRPGSSLKSQNAVDGRAREFFPVQLVRGNAFHMSLQDALPYGLEDQARRDAAILAPLMKQLRGDGAGDDSVVMQQIINLANEKNVKNISLPAGTFNLKDEVWFYGTDITLSGQGDRTILQVDHHYQAGKAGGWAVRISPKFAPHNYMVAELVTKDTIVLHGAVDIKKGEKLFLTNGRGSAREAERRMGGEMIGPGLFKELATVDYVQVNSVSTNEAGNTVLNLRGDLKNASEYFNLAPMGGTIANENYLHIKRPVIPAENLAFRDIMIRFADMKADSAFFCFYTLNSTLARIYIANIPEDGGPGDVGIVGTIGTHVRNVRAPASDLALSSSRYLRVTGCICKAITLEEGVTDSVIERNNLTNQGTIGLRTGDMLCARDSFLNNTLYAGSVNTGSIGIWEGTDITIEGNVIKGAGEATIWLGRTRGSKVHGNVARKFANYTPLSTPHVQGNSWEK